MALSVKKATIVLGLRFIVSMSNFDRYFGVTFSICANSSTRRKCINPAITVLIIKNICIFAR